MKYSFLIIIIIIILAAIILSCEKADLSKIDNLNNGKIDIIGHGGAGFQSVINPLPTNSFTSIRKAIDGLNADGVEIDFKVSNDSIAILFHDEVLEGSTNCIGCPENFSAINLLNCKYKNHYGSRLINEENLVSLQQIINHFKTHIKLPLIYASTKLGTICTVNNNDEISKYSSVITQLIQQNNAHQWIYVYDGDVNVLNNIRSFDPNIKLYLNAQNFNDALDACIKNNYTGMVIETVDINKEQVKQAHDNNVRITIWGLVYRKDIINAIEKNPDALMPDNIEIAQEILRK